MKSSRVVIFLCVLTPLIVSCRSTGSQDFPTLSNNVQVVGEYKTLDEQYLEIAEQIPGFAGIYEGDDGVSVAKIADNPALTEQRVPPTM